MFCLKLETDHHRSRRTKLRNIDQFISERLRHICVQDSEREMNDLAKGWYYHFILDWGTEKWRKLSLLPGAVVVVCELWGETCEDQRLERWEWCSQAQFSQNIVRWDEGNSEHTNIFFAESPEPGLATLLIQLVQNCLIEKLNSSGAWLCVSECWHYPATIITDWVRSDCCCWQEIISSNWSSQFSSVVSHPETSPAHTTTQHCSHCQLWSYQSRLRAEIFQNLAQLIVAEFVRLHCSVWSVTNSISLIFYVYIPHPAASHRGDENKTEFSSLCKCNDVVLNLTQVSSRRMRGGSLCLVILVSKLWTHKHILQNFLTNTSRC